MINKILDSKITKLLLLNFLVFILNLFLLSLSSVKNNIDKPILYLYPKENQIVNVRLEKGNLVKTSYPKYNNGWIVEASVDGNLKIDDKNYYALYWDEYNMHEVDFSEGFYVEDKDAINFLEDKLNIIGLNEREANEFIMYWLPILEDNQKSIIYFELTDEREKNNRLIIEPTPDSLLRVVIHVKKVNEEPRNIKEQRLVSFERKGFTVVEWGGVKY